MGAIATFLSLINSIFATLFCALCPPSFRKKDVRDDIVLITGAGSGIGRILAVRFSKLASTVVLWDINEKGNLETAKLISDDGNTAFAYTCDLSNKDDIYKTAKKVKDEVGIVTMLINNAGVVGGKPFLDTPDHVIENTFAVNSLAHFWTTKAFLPDMLSIDKGHIVNISSAAAYFGINNLNEYCASKAAAVAFNESLQTELRVSDKKNINVTLVCPFLIDTGMFSGASSAYIPILKPGDVANKIVEEVLLNSKMVVLPKYIFILVVLRVLLPYRISDWIYDLFDTQKMMATFRGRNVNTAKTD